MKAKQAIIVFTKSKVFLMHGRKGPPYLILFRGYPDPKVSLYYVTCTLTIRASLFMIPKSSLLTRKHPQEIEHIKQ